MILPLHENIQFIYELVMAERELSAAHIKYELLTDRRRFDVREPFDRGFVMRRSAYIMSVDEQPTDYDRIQDRNQTGSWNQYLTHWFYPFKGKFHPQLVRALLNLIELDQGQIVLDPFVGSGTTALEAQLLGIQCIGVDISPLCCLMSRVKTRSWRYLTEIQEVGDEILNHLTTSAREMDEEYGGQRQDVNYAKLGAPAGLLDYRDTPVGEFADLAWLMAISDFSRRKRKLESSIVTNWEKMVASVGDHVRIGEELGLSYPDPQISEGDASNLTLDDDSVDGIITSPPYSIALNYVKNDAHALQAMGYELEEMEQRFVGVRGTGMQKFALYEKDMKAAVGEMHRVLRPGGKCAIVIGDAKYDKRTVDTSGMIDRACRDVGLRWVERIPKIIHGLYNIMQKEYILIFAKP